MEPGLPTATSTPWGGGAVSHAALLEATELGPLKPGRGGHDLSPEEVAAVQRQRILRATVVVTAAKGYAALTVADVTREAKVSRRTFYEQFRDKADVFMATVEHTTQVLAEAMVASAAPTGDDWLAGVRSMVARYLEELAADPPTARVLFIELRAAGPRGLEHRARVALTFTRTFAALYEQARAGDPELPEIPFVAFELANGGFDAVLTEAVREGRYADLPRLADLAVYLARVMPAGHHTAADLLTKASWT